MYSMVNANKYISTSDLAKKLGVSRVTIFKRIKSGKYEAEKIGRNYVIDIDSVPELREMSAQSQKTIEKAVEKTIKEYGEALKLLGKE